LDGTPREKQTVRETGGDLGTLGRNPRVTEKMGSKPGNRRVLTWKNCSSRNEVDRKNPSAGEKRRAPKKRDEPHSLLSDVRKEAAIPFGSVSEPLVGKKNRKSHGGNKKNPNLQGKECDLTGNQEKAVTSTNCLGKETRQSWDTLGKGKAAEKSNDTKKF